MTNGDVAFTTKFRLDLSPKRVVITDTIDYAGLGEAAADFKGVLMISGPEGVIYNNTDFSNPDIDPGVSKDSIIQINLPLDPENNYEVRHGEYTVKYTVQKTATEDEYYNSDTYGFSFDEPTMDVDVDSGPYSAKLRSDDETDYGSDISLLTREHRIQYPAGLGFADIVTTDASYIVDPIYTNEWTTIVTSTVDYKQGDDLEYRWYGTKTVTHCVTGSCISSFYSSIDEVLTLYQGYIGTNPNMAGIFRERLQQMNTAWQLLDIAWMYVDLEEADKQSEVIREILEDCGIDMCPSGSSVIVNACPEWGGGEGGGFYTAGAGISIDVVGKVISLTDYGELKISTDDTTPGFIEDKFTVSHGGNVTNILELTTLSAGGNETRQLQLDESKISHDNISDVSSDDHHAQAHVLATSGDHTGALPLTDLDNYAVGALMYGGAADWAVLSAGTDGYVLKMGATYPAWAESGTYTHPNHTGHVTSTGDGATVLTVSSITGQTELASGLVGTDELVLSDGGVIKRMDISVVQTFMQDNLNFSGASFWTKVVNDIHYPDGSVGINDVSFAYKFNVGGDSIFTDVIRSDHGIKSDPFTSTGFTGSGYSLWEDASSKINLELDNLKVRGRMDIYEIVINKYRAVNGVLWVTDVADTYEDIDGSIESGLHEDSTTLTGTVTVVQSSYNVVGSGTLFTSELAVEDEIKINTERFIVEVINDNTHLDLKAVYAGTNDSGVTAYKKEYYLNIGKEGSSFTEHDLIVAQKFQSPSVVRFEYRVEAVVDATDYWKVYVGNEDKWLILDDPTEDVTGHTFLRFGNTTTATRQGSLLLDANDDDNPYFQILDGVDSFTVTFSDIKVMAGNLESIASQGIVPVSPGYGFYSDNVYITGKMIISNPSDINTGDLTNTAGFTNDTAANAAQADATTALGLIPNDASGLIDFSDTPSGAGLYLGATHLGYYSGSAWKTYMASNGDFFLNGTSGYLTWDHSLETLTIKGTINASDGNIGGWDLTANSIHHGAEKLTDGYATAGTATIAADGSIHLPNFYVNAEPGGESGLSEVEEVLFKVDASGRGIKIAGADIWEDEWNNDTSSILINMKGYDGGYTKYRYLQIGNGQNDLVLGVGGSTSYDRYIKAWGQFILAGGIRSDVNYIIADDTLTFEDYITIVNSASARIVTLPLSPIEGEQHWVKRAGAGAVTISGNGTNITAADGDHASIAITDHRGTLLVYSSSLGKWSTFGLS